MKYLVGMFCCCFCLVVMISLTNPSQETKGVEPAVLYFKIHADSFAIAAMQLQTALGAIDENKPVTVLQARQALTTCRVYYKK
ncbi:hypothetical protein [Paraflavitalea speifideaquila]|uniref:hypothetical protein n=1 Tax=Paraflavitalea speifideaquila TaxID=3076558 RepID=UPI0028E52A67|nr:hypothetical protein [Paraflavitalea speifideiaquila]